MPLINYVLLALIASGGAAGPTTTLGPDAMVQPNGGALLGAEQTPKKDDRRHPTLTTNYTRHKKRVHRHKIHSTVKHSAT